MLRQHSSDVAGKSKGVIDGISIGIIEIVEVFDTIVLLIVNKQSNLILSV